MDAELIELARRLGEVLKARQLFVATAESCTGGWVGRVITAVPGSSHWYDRGFITYTNQSKQDMLGVSAETLELLGAVSEETVQEMAEGALAHSQARLSVAISGIAGPSGGTPDKPVGTVCLAWAGGDKAMTSMTCHFAGDREQVRYQAVQTALEGLIKQVS
jgi:nicotinamide-nucleotide amidase